MIVWSTLISKGQSNPITCCADIKILDCEDSECDLRDLLFCCFCVLALKQTFVFLTSEDEKSLNHHQCDLLSY